MGHAKQFGSLILTQSEKMKITQLELILTHSIRKNAPPHVQLILLHYTFYIMH